MAVVIDGTNGITTPLDVEIQGATSGSILLAAPAVAGTNTQTLVAATGTLAPLIAGTAVASTSGTSIDFTSIPSWVKRVTVIFSGVSTSGASRINVRLGTSSGVDSTGYLGASAFYGASAGNVALSSGFTDTVADAAHTRSGTYTITLVNPSTNTWVCSATGGLSDLVYIWCCGGTKSLSGALDRVRITTVNGTDTFDAGTINIMYE